jgi:hypothetical protein
MKIKTQSIDTCVDCAISKAKQKNVPKVSKHSATEKGERVAIDITSIKTISYGGAKFWLMIQDEFTGKLWSYFLKAKSDLPETVIKWINEIHKTTTVKIKSIRCDNAGENKSLQNQIESKKDLNIKFEFTAPYTPEMNGKIERKFATLYGKTRSMLNGARLTKELRDGLWAQCAKLACKLENILVGPNDTKSSMEKFDGELPKWVKNLRTFGEVAIISDEKNKKIRSKLTDRGFPALFVGYADNHAADVFEFFNLKTKALIMSRNVIWLNQNYSQYKNITSVNKVILNDDEEDDEAIPKNGEADNEQEDNDMIQDNEDEQNEEDTNNDIGRPIPHSRLAGEIKRLTCEWNQDPMEHA